MGETRLGGGRAYAFRRPGNPRCTVIGDCVQVHPLAGSHAERRKIAGMDEHHAAVPMDAAVTVVVAVHRYAVRKKLGLAGLGQPSSFARRIGQAEFGRPFSIALPFVIGGAATRR
jgi:hypothetical protein